MRPRWMSWIIRACLTTLGLCARPLQFDKSVSINNWFFTTSMLNHLNDDEIRGLKILLREHFPDHAWVYREFKSSDTRLAEALSENGFRRLVHRPIFEWQPQEYREKKLKRKVRAQIQHDLSLTEEGPYSVRHAEKGASMELTARFYEDLYIRKHSRFNAHFTSKFFDTVLSTGINQLSFFELEGRTVGFLTTCPDSDRVIASLVGYDQSINQPRASPYSAAVGEAFRQSLKSGKTLFLSTGAAAFKKRRGAHESMEYEAFDVSHLGLFRRLPWYSIQKFLDALIGSMDTESI
jgi:Acetyltransferase (GNAT) domain